MSGPIARPVPSEPIALDDVWRLWPTLRQSLLAKMDDCPLSTLFELRYARGWSTHPQALGTLFHRVAAKCLETMRAVDSETIPVGEALAILDEVVRQADVPPDEIVRVPLRDMRDLRMAVIKLANDNAFSVRKLIDVEKRLEATVSYVVAETGERVERRLTGQLDALIFEPPDRAVVVDFKSSWALPPEPRDVDGPTDGLKGLSYHGYFQQRFYALLVLRNFPRVQSVTLREFYVRKTEVRKATVHRAALTEIEDEMSVLAEAFDRAVAEGAPAWPYKVQEMGRWVPQPGRHCSMCAATRQCPIEEDARLEAGGGIATLPQAERAAAELVLVEQARSRLIEGLKGWVEGGGKPVRVRWSKGRRVLGWYRTKRGRRFGFFTPDLSDRGGHSADIELENAMREATARARRERVA